MISAPHSGGDQPALARLSRFLDVLLEKEKPCTMVSEGRTGNRSGMQAAGESTFTDSRALRETGRKEELWLETLCRTLERYAGHLEELRSKTLFNQADAALSREACITGWHWEPLRETDGLLIFMGNSTGTRLPGTGRPFPFTRG